MNSDARRRGFALPAVLAVTGVATLIFLVAITALASLTAEAASARARVRFLQQALSTEAAVAYLAATEPMAAFGLAVGAPRYVESLDGLPPPPATGEVSQVRLDGRTYRFDAERGPVFVSLQDQAGLANIPYLSEDSYRRLVGRAGASMTNAASLRARYLDYVDPDSLTRLNGAEDRDDNGTGPANRNLLRPSEWLSVPGVRDAVDPVRWRAVKGDLAADPSNAQFNINTATPGALEIQFGLTEPQALAALEARETLPFRSLTDLAAASGAALRDDGERFYVFPSPQILFFIRDGSSAWTYRGRISLTPGGLEQPLWIEQTELNEAPNRTVATAADAPRLPLPTR